MMQRKALLHSRKFLWLWNIQSHLQNHYHRHCFHIRTVITLLTFSCCGFCHVFLLWRLDHYLELYPRASYFIEMKSSTIFPSFFSVGALLRGVWGVEGNGGNEAGVGVACCWRLRFPDPFEKLERVHNWKSVNCWTWKQWKYLLWRARFSIK